MERLIYAENAQIQTYIFGNVRRLLPSTIAEC